MFSQLKHMNEKAKKNCLKILHPYLVLHLYLMLGVCE